MKFEKIRSRGPGDCLDDLQGEEHAEEILKDVRKMIRDMPIDADEVAKGNLAEVEKICKKKNTDISYKMRQHLPISNQSKPHNSRSTIS